MTLALFLKLCLHKTPRKTGTSLGSRVHQPRSLSRNTLFSLSGLLYYPSHSRQFPVFTLPLRGLLSPLPPTLPPPPSRGGSVGGGGSVLVITWTVAGVRRWMGALYTGLIANVVLPPSRPAALPATPGITLLLHAASPCYERRAMGEPSRGVFPGLRGRFRRAWACVGLVGLELDGPELVITGEVLP